MKARTFVYTLYIIIVISIAVYFNIYYPVITGAATYSGLQCDKSVTADSSLTGAVTGTACFDNVFSMDANNINLDCAGYNISGTGTTTGIYINNKNNINLIKCNTINGFTNGILVGGTSNNITIINTTFASNTNDVNSSSSGEVYLLNSSFNFDAVNVTGAGKVYVRWYLKVNVTDTSNISISGANVSLTQNNSNVELNGTTGTDGIALFTNVTEKYKDSVGTSFYTNYTIHASYTNYVNNSAQVNLTSSRTVHITLLQVGEDLDPAVSIVGPDDSSINNTAAVTFEATATDDYKVNNLTLKIYNSSGLYSNITNATKQSNDTGYNFSVVLEENDYNWTMTACDNATSAQCVSASNRSLRIDLTAPSWSSNQTTEELVFNRSIQLNATLSDKFNLSSVLFSWNATGQWYNYSNLSISGLSWTLSINKSLGNMTPSGTVAWTFYFNDSARTKNQTSIFTKQLLNLYPGWSNNQTNASGVFIYSNVTFNISLSDEFNLSYWIFSWNGSNITGLGSGWDNRSNGTLSEKTATLIINKKINLTSGNAIGWTFYFNDSNNAWNQSVVSTIIITAADIPPTWSSNKTTEDFVFNRTVQLNVTFSDSSGLSSVLFSWNGTPDGSWYNYSNLTAEGTTWIISINKSLGNLTPLGTVAWTFYANDSENNKNQTPIFTKQLLSLYPWWSNNQTTEDLVFNRGVMFNVTLSDEYNLSSVLFSWNGTVDGSWYNYSNLSISGNSWVVSTNVSLGNLTPAGTVAWTFYFNDSSNQKNQSAVFTKKLLSFYPSFSNNQTNASGAGINRIVIFNITVADSDSELSYWIFSWNGTGSWDNSSNSTLSGTSQTLTVNKTINLSYNNVIGYVWHANDSSGNWNLSELRKFTVGFYCGDGSCDGDESCSSCGQDCGTCPSGGSGGGGGGGGGETTTPTEPPTTEEPPTEEPPTEPPATPTEPPTEETSLQPESNEPVINDVISIIFPGRREGSDGDVDKLIFEYNKTKENIKINRTIFYDNLTNRTFINITIIPDRVLYNFSYYEKIPKCIALLIKEGMLNESEIIFHNKNFEVLQEDPLIVWRFAEVRGPLVLSYEVHKKLLDECINLLEGLGIAEDFGPLLEKPKAIAGWVKIAAPIIAIPIIAYIFIYFSRFTFSERPVLKKAKPQKKIKGQLKEIKKRILIKFEK